MLFLKKKMLLQKLKQKCSVSIDNISPNFLKSFISIFSLEC